MVDEVQSAFWVTTADYHGSFGPRAGSGSVMAGGTESGCGFGSQVQSPAAAP